MRGLLILAVSCAFAVGCQRAAAGPSPATAAAPAPSRRVPGEYLVTLAPGADPGAIEAVYGHLGLKRVRALGPGRYLVAVGEDPGPERMEALRAGDARIEAVQPNFLYGAPR